MQRCKKEKQSCLHFCPKGPASRKPGAVTEATPWDARSMRAQLLRHHLPGWARGWNGVRGRARSVLDAEGSRCAPARPGCASSPCTGWLQECLVARVRPPGPPDSGAPRGVQKEAAWPPRLCPAPRECRPGRPGWGGVELHGQAFGVLGVSGGRPVWKPLRPGSVPKHRLLLRTMPS